MNAQNRHDLKMLQRHLDAIWEEQQTERRAHQVPRAKKTEEIDVDEILDEIEDEEFDDLDEDDDPTTDRPAKKKGRARKTSSKKSSAKKTEEGGVGTADVAEAAGTDSRSLRMLLRKEFPKEEGGRYHWSSLNHPEVKAIIKRVRSGGTQEAKAASLDKLKASKGKKKSSAKSTGKKTTATKSDAAKKRAAARRKARRAAAAEDDE